MSLAAKSVCLGSVKREISTYYVTKSRTSLYFPQELSQLATTWFIARQVWFVGGKTRNIAIQLVLQQCCITSCTFPLKVNSDLRPRPHLGCDNTTSTQGSVVSSGFSEKQGFVGVAQCRGLTKSPSGRSYFVFAPRLSRYFFISVFKNIRIHVDRA